MVTNLLAKEIKDLEQALVSVGGELEAFQEVKNIKSWLKTIQLRRMQDPLF